MVIIEAEQGLFVDYVEDLRQLVFGTAAVPMHAEWTRTPFVFAAPKEQLSYGLRSARNATRGLLTVVQGFVVKYLLFGHHQQIGAGGVHPYTDFLRPSAELQKEALIMAMIEILLLIADKDKIKIVLLASADDDPFVEHNVHYFHDTVTEKLLIFTLSTRDELEQFLRLQYEKFTGEDQPGTLLFLYSAVLTRTLGKVRLDLDTSKHAISLTKNDHEEGSLMLVTLLLTGRATPYVHNGVLNVADEKGYSMPQYGILSRCTIGFLIWQNDNITQSTLSARMDSTGSTQPGSRLKTPNYPIWITSCAGHYGLLFSRNSELLRNYHAEAHFDLYYYSCSGHQIAMTIDNRTQHNVAALSCGLVEREPSIAQQPFQSAAHVPRVRPSSSTRCLTSEVAAAACGDIVGKEAGMLNKSTPLLGLIHTKWPEAQILYHAQASMLSYLFNTNLQ